MNINSASLQKALEIQKQIETLQTQLAATLAGTATQAEATPANEPVAARSRKFTPEGLELIRQAQLRRWRKARKAAKAVQTAPVTPAPVAPVVVPTPEVPVSV